MARLKSTSLYWWKNADSRRSTTRRSLTGGKIIRITLVRYHNSPKFLPYKAPNRNRPGARVDYFCTVNLSYLQMILSVRKLLLLPSTGPSHACDRKKSIVDWLLCCGAILGLELQT